MSAAKEGARAAGAGRYKPYPAYKDSGVEWLGEIPAGWEVAPVYARYEVALGKMLDAKRVTGEFSGPYLRNVDVQWDMVNTEGLPEMDFAPWERERFSVRPGDLLVCEGGEVGRTAIWRGEIEPCFYQKALHRVRPRANRDDPRLFFYLMNMVAKRGVFAGAGNQNTIDHLTAVQLKHYRFPFAPEPEQRAIAAFLDRETARIDALVAKKERLIALLQEQRTALITRAVTKGLDPTVPMKDSGVEWLGEIPAHWEVKRLKRVSAVENSGAYGAEPGEGAVDLPVCTTAHLTIDGRFLVDEMPVRGFSMLDAAHYIGAPGDIFVVKSSGSNTNIISGKLGLVTETTPKLVFSNFLMRIRPHRSSVFPEFLAYLLRSELTRERIQRMVATTTYPNIDVPEYVGSAIAIPSIDEQRAVADVLDRETARIDALVAKVREAIDRLKELRTALISAAVTGKIDVREQVA
jgi:type I restriction enzyme S subunit